MDSLYERNVAQIYTAKDRAYKYVAYAKIHCVALYKAS